MAKTYFISVRLDEEIRSEVEELALRMDRPLAWVCRDALEAWLKKHSRKRKR